MTERAPEGQGSSPYSAINQPDGLRKTAFPLQDSFSPYVKHRIGLVGL